MDPFQILQNLQLCQKDIFKHFRLLSSLNFFPYQMTKSICSIVQIINSILMKYIGQQSQIQIDLFLIFTLFTIMLSYIIIILSLLSLCTTLINILDQGAIPHTDTITAQYRNSAIIKNSILKANLSSTDRAVKIPKGTFYSMPIVLHDIHNLTIIVQGKLSASKNILKWLKKPNSPKYEDFIYISDSSYIEIQGGGRIDGRGYHWWMVEWLRLKKLRPLNSARPHLINIERCQYFKIHDLILKNSPCFHVRIYGSFHFDIYNMDIKVNTTAQFNLAKKFSAEGIVPLFPLNTDGIDPAGRYFHIWNITVQNYDDVVVPKPSHGGTNCNCTQDMLIENITVRLGVGLSIGSVPPNAEHNCIRNITFRNAQFEKPFKAIYIKTNPGNSGSGEIKHIIYQNMKINEPIWWAIYLGPQQQKQPLGGGPGCMLYPFDPRGTCQTQPRIDIRNVTLSNIEIYKSLLFPIVLRCNQTNPCTDINLYNVKVDKWFIGKRKQGFVCENVKGKQQGGKPKVTCLNQQIQNQEKDTFSQEHIRSMDSMSAKQMLNYLQQKIKSVPYIEEDDEMIETSDELYQQLIESIEEEQIM